MLSPIVEILVIGNEVLAGNVLDSNSHWLCGQVSARGGQVRRVTVLRDDPAEIEDGLLAALARRPALIVTCGGLGPTQDDLTVAAIAAALGREVAEHPAAYAMVRDLYARLFALGEVTTPDMLPQRAKMAQLPASAEPLENRVGAAPGVLLQHDGSTLVALPGVPAEMKDIFTHSLLPRLGDILPEQAYGERTIRTRVWDESDPRAGSGRRRAASSPRLREVARPGVRIGRGGFCDAGRTRQGRGGGRGAAGRGGGGPARRAGAAGD